MPAPCGVLLPDGHRLPGLEGRGPYSFWAGGLARNGELGLQGGGRLLVLQGVSLVVRSLRPLVGEVQLELLEGLDGEVQYLSVRCLGPLVS